VIVDSGDVSRWFGEYLDAFAACGRGESDAASLLAYYGVPLLLTTDGGFLAGILNVRWARSGHASGPPPRSLAC
jgi:hypothetical protein